MRASKSGSPSCCWICSLFSFFFNDTATTEIYTLSLHDALPIGHKRIAARVLLPASPVAAAAEPPVRHDAVVAGFTADSPTATIEFAVHDDATANTGPHRYENDVAIAMGRTKSGLRPYRRVGIVLHHDGDSQAILDHLLHRLATPRKIWRKHDVRTGFIDKPGNSQANRPNSMTAHQLGYNITNGDGRLLRAARRCRPPQLLDNPALLVHHSRR